MLHFSSCNLCTNAVNSKHCLHLVFRAALATLLFRECKTWSLLRCDFFFIFGFEITMKITCAFVQLILYSKQVYLRDALELTLSFHITVKQLSTEKWHKFCHCQKEPYLVVIVRFGSFGPDQFSPTHNHIQLKNGT